MSNKMCTIGFSKKKLRVFIDLLQKAGVTKLIDTRLNNTSQLAGFSKKDDLSYILELVGINYIHEPLMAPTQEILKGYKEKEITWAEYENAYIHLLENRNILPQTEELIAGETVCFLCSEEKPDYCHRRLLVEYLESHLTKDIEIQHLV